jgi:hypothetical protein
MSSSRRAVGVALGVLVASGCGGSSHDSRSTDQKPVSVAAVVRAFERQGVHLLRFTPDSPTIGVVVTSPEGFGRAKTTTSVPKGWPGPGPAHLGWFEAFNVHPKTYAVVDVHVYRTAGVARRAEKSVAPGFNRCWHHKNVVLCELQPYPASRSWLRLSLRALEHL